VETLGAHSYISGKISNNFGIDIEIGKFTSIAEGLEVIASNHPTREVSTFPFREIYKLEYSACSGYRKITIGNDVWIGMGVAIREGIVIGDGSVIGAKSVVVEDVMPYSIMAGNPTRLVRYRFSAEATRKLLDIKWWDWEFEFIRANMQDFMDVSAFIDKYGKEK
jgi:acetyltransferase-like isoleucine patch superfamily enzyme